MSPSAFSGLFEIRAERLAALFVELCEIDSPSRSEGRVATFLAELFRREFGAEIFTDNSAASTGSDCGNLIVRCSGAPGYVPVFFNCHTDTVQPGTGVKVVRDGDRFFSAGETVLGGDDKAGIAILIETLRVLRENGIPHAPVEFLFTTCEEIGLLGAKAFEPERLRARYGFALDSSGIDVAVIGAPAANHLCCDIYGVAAHAGLNPEKGVSALLLAANALAGMRLGRLDEDSTANIGLIRGGTATNIIPDFVHLEGEVRSHSAEKLAFYTAEIEAHFRRCSTVAAEGSGKTGCSFSASLQYPAMRLAEDSAVLSLLDRAAFKLQRSVKKIVAGGGSDANIFNAKGLQTAILGIGMSDVHSTKENISLFDLVRTAELICSLLTA